MEHKFGLPVEFSPETLQEIEGIPDRLIESEIEGREDFRSELAVTIDGETARDFDDAVSLTKLASGNYLLAVHIADVSHYVREGTAVDRDAYARGTSVYFPDRAIPMLPPALSSGICSLKPREEEVTFVRSDCTVTAVVPNPPAGGDRYARDREVKLRQNAPGS